MHALAAVIPHEQESLRLHMLADCVSSAQGLYRRKMRKGENDG